MTERCTPYANTIISLGLLINYIEMLWHVLRASQQAKKHKTSWSAVSVMAAAYGPVCCRTGHASWACKKGDSVVAVYDIEVTGT